MSEPMIRATSITVTQLCFDCGRVGAYTVKTGTGAERTVCVDCAATLRGVGVVVEIRTLRPTTDLGRFITGMRFNPS